MTYSEFWKPKNGRKSTQYIRVIDDYISLEWKLHKVELSRLSKWTSNFEFNLIFIISQDF